MGEITASKKFKASIGRLLKSNRDEVAKSDKELGEAHAVKMRIPTGQQVPIKLKIFRRDIHMRPLARLSGVSP